MHSDVTTSSNVYACRLVFITDGNSKKKSAGFNLTSPKTIL